MKVALMLLLITASMNVAQSYAAPSSAIDCTASANKDASACKERVKPATAARPSTAHTKPTGLQVVDELPPPPNVLFDKNDQSGGRASATPTLPSSPSGAGKLHEEISVTKSGEDTVTEYRIRGRLYKQKVQPPSGAAYTLIDEKGDGKFIRYDGPEQRLSVPTWVILTW